MQCGNCTEICEDCGTVCLDCADTVCQECGKCSGCIDEICPECSICIECAGIMCGECYYCADCAEIICENCGMYCSDCAVICEECGQCENCIDICPDCDKCADCCADAASEYGCSHGICVNSSEWGSHYCTYGSHCIEDSTEYGHDNSVHWNVCDEGCDVKLNTAPHSFGKGEVTKEATKSSDGVLTVTCVICGYEKNEAIPKLTGGHTHTYTETVTAPTCTDGGYTTHSCSCGHTWRDNETPATSHDYQYKYTADEHWQECTVCHDTTESASHKLGAWNTVVKPGYTYKGVKQRECKHCGYTLADEIEMLKVPEDKVVITIPSYPATPDPSTPVGGEDDGPSKPGADTENPGGSTTPATTVKEVLTKGKDNTVPALPTLPPNENGNIFDGWVDKETGETVKKGDKITGSIELIPVWKDCGDGKHTDSDGDNNCDECGYILVKETKPDDEKKPPETDAPAKNDPQDGDGKAPKSPAGGIIAGIGSAGLVAIVSVAAVLSRKKKKEKSK